MSLAATYPRLADLERRFGSLTAGVRALTRSGRPAAPIFYTLKGGMGELVERLAQRLPRESLHLGRPVHALEPVPGGSWRVRLDDFATLEAENVILALPAFTAAELLTPVDSGLGRRLGALRDVSLATLSLGYRGADLGRPLEGYGFFVPRGEVRTVLACTWTSAKFDHRASAGGRSAEGLLGRRPRRGRPLRDRRGARCAGARRASRAPGDHGAADLGAALPLAAGLSAV